MTSRSEPRGFTLLELLIVLAIMGLMLTIVLIRGPLVSQTLTVRQAAAEVAGALREARATAIGTDHRIAVTFDSVDHSYAIGDRPPRRLHGRFELSVVTVAGAVRNERQAAIRFDPDGSSSGGRVILGQDGHKLTVGVEWLNGRVSVADAP